MNPAGGNPARFHLPPAPHGHDIIVIGASAGGLLPLRRILGDLPADLPAAVFIVMHLGRTTLLAEVLRRAAPLPMKRAASGERVRRGQVYVAVPGCHLLLHDRHVLLRRGPQENLARPAIDPLFRSAAASFGSGVVGVVLSGSLNDGTAGLRAIKRCGGVAIVQDPADAAFDDMPRGALRHVAVDGCVPTAGIGPLVAHLARMPRGPTPPILCDIRLEAAIAAQELATMENADRLGAPSRFTCAECHGAWWEINDGGVLRYRCHVGHAFTGEALMTAEAEQIEPTLWSLLRAHRERAAIIRRLAQRETSEGCAGLLKARAEDADRDADVLRSLMGQPRGIAAGNAAGDDAV